MCEFLRKDVCVMDSEPCVRCAFYGMLEDSFLHAQIQADLRYQGLLVD